MLYWEPEVQCRILKGPPITLILSQVNPISRTDTYFFKIHSNIALRSTANWLFNCKNMEENFMLRE